MKTYLITLSCLLLLASCSKYQINLVNSENVAKDQETGQFKMENDSVKITYSFLGKNAALQVSILNKLNQPMYIDWKKSSLIVDGKSYTYANNMVSFNGELTGINIGNQNNQISQANIQATATLPTDVTFIPAHTEVSNNLNGVAAYTPTNLDRTAFKTVELPTTDLGQTLLANAADFTYQNSPFHFENYLTLYTITNNQPAFTSVRHTFYISRIIKTTINPTNFKFTNEGRNDYYYTAQATTYGKIATVTLVSGAVAGVAAIGAAQNNTH